MKDIYLSIFLDIVQFAAMIAVHVASVLGHRIHRIAPPINTGRERVMKEFIGFGVLLALIVAPMAMAANGVPGDGSETYNVFPVVPSGIGPYSSFLAVTNYNTTVTGDWSLDDGKWPLVIITHISGGVLNDQTNKFELGRGDTLFVQPSEIDCASGNICKVTICAPNANTQADPSTAIPSTINTPAMTSMLFWTNDGAVIAITDPIAAAVSTGGGICSTAN
jgi:hypothetical protein